MTLSRYILGYLLSIALTFMGPLLLWLHESSGHQFPTHPELFIAFVVFALCQFVVQLIFFFHLGTEKKSGGTLTMLAFAIIVVGILVGGTLWIMYNLQSQHSMPQEFKNNVASPENQLQ